MGDPDPGSAYIRESQAEDDKLVTQERRQELAREKVRSIRHQQICSPEWSRRGESVRVPSAYVISMGGGCR